MSEKKKVWAVFMTSENLWEGWLSDSIRDTKEEVEQYCRENAWKLERAAGINGDWSIHEREVSENGT